jgi:hypothetical protein
MGTRKMITNRLLEVSFNTAILQRCLKITSIFGVTDIGSLNTLHNHIQISYNTQEFVFTTENGSEICKIEKVPYTSLQVYDQQVLENGFTVFVELEVLVNFISSLPSNEVKFIFTNTCLEIDYGGKKGNRTKYELTYFNSSTYMPDIQQLIQSQETTGFLVLDKSLLSKITDLLLPASAKDSARAFLSGCYIDNSCICSTNSRLLAHLTLDDSVKRVVPSPFFLPERVIKLLDSLDLSLTLQLYTYHIVCYTTIPDSTVSIWILTSIKDVSQFPNFMPVLDATKSYSQQVTLLTSDLKSVIRLLTPFVDLTMRSLLSISIESNDYMLFETVTTSNSRKGCEEVPVISITEPLQAKFSTCLSLSDVSSIISQLSEGENINTIIYLGDNNEKPIGFYHPDYSYFLVVSVFVVSSNDKS